ncbi:17-beta-hydroxysteroid dehydrogenase 14-like [Heteronotia binoei]|uniref:17-beta-hydroxysteroid dehydrogenase 14-like n=1 Tax=Heteronotia binoei TaxID=13085 RepID=UPI0029316D56|nr:17-beta-hydroxysteroid dehydrogenase 14-like [Heteronotia binoei]
METLLRYPGKVVILTGGTSGIGLATVKEFVHQGANVVFCSKASEAQKGQEIQRELQVSGCPGEACFQVCDVRKESDIKRLIRVTLERYGCLDCLVNNAADAYRESIDDMAAQDFKNIMEVNVVSCLLLSKYALPYLRQTKGNIINVGSIVGTIGMKDFLSATVSKGAVIAMTKALAIDESKYGVRVNCISPGNTWTPLWESKANCFKNPKAVIQEGESFQLLGRLGTPEEVALGILFLATDATFCTGLDLLITGGAEIGFGIKYPMGPDTSPSDLQNMKDPPPAVRRPTKTGGDKS